MRVEAERGPKAQKLAGCDDGEKSQVTRKGKTYHVVDLLGDLVSGKRGEERESLEEPEDREKEYYLISDNWRAKVAEYCQCTAAHLLVVQGSPDL